MTTIIIGGGITGLSAGYYLNDDVIIIEKNVDMGGLCSSYHIKNEKNDYYIEKFYHHFFERDVELREICEKLGLDIEWGAGSVGYSFNGIVYPLNSPYEILQYPHLTLIEKARLALFTLMCKRADPGLYKNKKALEFILENTGERVFKKFFLPLLKGKFGDDYYNVSAAWLIVRIQLRSSRGMKGKGEKLGYINGGFHELVDALENAIVKKGGKILKETEVKEIIINNGKAEGVITDKGMIKADNVICTSPHVMLKYNGSKMYFQKTVCSIFALKKKISDTYWVNIGDDLSFKALIEHTNFIPVERYGENLLYAVIYSSHPIEVESTIRSFRSDLKKYGINDKDIIWEKTLYETATAPMYNIGYEYVPYESDTDGLYFAGIFSKANHHGRLVNGSIIAGKDVAKIINDKIKNNI